MSDLTTRTVMHDFVSSQVRKKSALPMEAKARFKEWIASVEREAAARALEEAAVGIFVMPASADAVYDALRARAAKYRKAVES